MAYSNIDQAVTYGPNQVVTGFAQQLLAQGERNKLLRQRDEEEQRQRQDMLTKYVGQEFQNKDFMTGSAFDPVINEKLAAAKQKYTAMIATTKGLNLADVYFQMQKEMSEIGGMSATIKNIKANTDKQSAALGKYPGIDNNALGQLAITKALYNVDPKTGSRTLKPIGEVDPNRDYVSQVITDHPELVSKGDQGMRAYLKTVQPQSLGEAVTAEHKGVTTEHKYTAKAPPYMELVKDAKGIATGVKVRSENVNGVDVADQDVYQMFNSDPSSSIVLQKMFKDWNRDQKTQVDPNSESAELVKRKLLFDYLGKNGVYEFKPESKQTNNTLRDKQDFGVPLYRQGLSDAAKLLKSDEKLKGLDAGLIMRGLGGDQTVLEGAPSEEIDGKTFYDITSSIGGIKLGYGTDRKGIYASKLMIDPISKTLYRIGTDGSEKSYKGAEIRAFIKRTAEYNGVTLDKADRTLNMFMDQSGTYTGKTNTEGLAALQAQQDFQKLNARKERLAPVDEFVKSGDADGLSVFKEMKLKDGSEIEGLGARNVLQKIGTLGQIDNYYVQIKGGKKHTFNTPKKLAEFLKNNIK